jgi:hypothetical protein
MCFFCTTKGGSLLQAAAPSSFTINHSSSGVKKSRVPGSGSSQFAAPTFKITEVDEHLKWNPYIWSGYRENYTFGQCLYSFFTIHNETGTPVMLLLLPLRLVGSCRGGPTADLCVRACIRPGNVWSHFIAVLVFLWAMRYTLYDILLPTTPLLHQVRLRPRPQDSPHTAAVADVWHSSAPTCSMMTCSSCCCLVPYGGACVQTDDLGRVLPHRHQLLRRLCHLPPLLPSIYHRRLLARHLGLHWYLDKAL